MYHHAVLLVFLHTFFTSTLCLQNSAPNSQTVLKNTEYNFRQAIREDIKDLTTVYLDAFSPGDAWKYTMPEYERYKNYTRYCLQETLEQAWENLDPRTHFIQVVSVPNSKSSVASGRKERVVAFGIWVLKEQNDTVISPKGNPVQILQAGLPAWNKQFSPSNPPSTPNCSAHLDTNLTRSVSFQHQFDAKTQFLEKAYPKQIYLNTLATHPDWDGHGFAALNLDWGFKLAERWEIPITLVASPAGWPLYDAKGYRSVRNVSIETLDGWGGGVLWFEAMDYVGSE